MDTKEILANAKEDMMRQLVDLAAEGRKPSDAEKYRDRARVLIREIGKAETALHSITAGAKNKYAHHKRAIEAILDYLNETGRAVPEEEITTALIEGGFRGGAPGTALVVQKSIRSYLFGTGRASGHIKKVGDLVGKGDWEKARFSA